MSTLTSNQQLACQRIKGIYAITPDLTNTDLIYACVQRALTAGIKLVQLRNKTLPLTELIHLGQRLRQLTHTHQATLIANDSLTLAKAIYADGLHIGHTDGTLSTIRDMWPGLLGVSCYADAALANNAYQSGADYVAFGSVYPSTTKPHAVSAALNLLNIDIPIAKVAIGGIGIAQLATVFQHGADACAMISGLFQPSQDLDQVDIQCQHAVLQYQLHKPRHLG